MAEPHAEIAVRLQPRADRDALVGLRDDDVLVARVTAPPVEGKANVALCTLVAKAVGVGRSRVTVVRGEKARDKVLRVEGLDAEAVRRALGGGAAAV